MISGRGTLATWRLAQRSSSTLFQPGAIRRSTGSLVANLQASAAGSRTAAVSCNAGHAFHNSTKAFARQTTTSCPASPHSATTYSGIGAKKEFSASVDGDHLSNIETLAQDYYEDPNAINFHNQVWGKDLHIGRFDLLKREDDKLEGSARIKRAAELATEILLTKAFPPSGPAPDKCTTMDMGSSTGSTARLAAKTYGCNMVCIDLSRDSNATNTKLSAAAGLSNKILIPGERSYFDTQMPSSSMDVVVSQDSFSHASTEHYRVIEEAARVLKPGGIMAFTDIMQSDTADPVKLKEVYKAVQIEGLARPGSYEKWANEYGLEFVKFDNQTPNFNLHYVSLLKVMASLRGTITGVDDSFLDWMAARYGLWATAAENDLVRWGMIVLKKPIS